MSSRQLARCHAYARERPRIQGLFRNVIWSYATTAGKVICSYRWASYVCHPHAGNITQIHGPYRGNRCPQIVSWADMSVKRIHAYARQDTPKHGKSRKKARSYAWTLVRCMHSSLKVARDHYTSREVTYDTLHRTPSRYDTQVKWSHTTSSWIALSYVRLVSVTLIQI